MGWFTTIDNLIHGRRTMSDAAFEDFLARITPAERQRARARRSVRGNSRWIRRAVRRPGALAAWLRRHEPKVRKVTGVDPFTKRGEIRQLALIRLRRSEWYARLSTRTKRRINFAITLKRMRRRR